MSSSITWHPSDASGQCVFTNPAGLPYEEITCLYPSLGKFYLPIELSYSPVPVRDWMARNPWLPVVACLLYGIGIIAGRQYFSTREAWNWRNTLAAWNLLLSVFSFWGLSRTLPVLLFNLWNYTWVENLCLDPESHFGSGSEGMWAQFFVLSKFPELLDTFFIVIHKKKLLFLHWYHHVTVLLFCWHGYVTKSSVGPFFIVMNLAVHAIMYFYYFLMAIKAKPKWFNPEWITMAQISQMIMGVFITANGWYLMLVTKPEGCYLTYEIQLACLIMYGSYLMLFVQFFWQRYSVKRVKKA